MGEKLVDLAERRKTALMASSKQLNEQHEAMAVKILNDPFVGQTQPLTTLEKIEVMSRMLKYEDALCRIADAPKGRTLEEAREIACKALGIPWP